MGKLYDPKKAREYIEKNKDKIASAALGMKEDWFWTATTVFEDGEYKHDLTGETVELAGIDGSGWATPILEVEFKDGTEIMIKCYKAEDA